jgi:hypothetical protein
VQEGGAKLGGKGETKQGKEPRSPKKKKNRRKGAKTDDLFSYLGAR